MKKFLFVFAIAAIGTLASCKKEYTCTCEVTNPITGDKIENSTTFEKMKKDEAEDKCNEGDVEGLSECEID